MSTTNLKEETIESVGGRTVQWVGSSDGKYAMSWDRFLEIADVNYDSGYGGQNIASDLVIVFTDGSWLERYEYDGRECWDHKQAPKVADGFKTFKTVCNGDSWASIKEMNRPGGKYHNDE